jgi:hypothetical protein
VWRGTPIAGRTTKTATNAFRVVFSATEPENRQNLKLLKEETWFDIPIVYGDGQRAIVALEKGFAGGTAFADALAANERSHFAEQPRIAEPPRFAQTAVLYEEDLTTQGQRYSGVVRWRTREEAAGAGANAQLALQAEIEIPEGHLTAQWSMLPNDDPSFPASHVIEIAFTPLAGFTHGGVSSLAGILVNRQEAQRGVPMTVQAARTVANSFLVALSRSEKQRNLTLLKENAWISIPIVFGDGHRAILVLEKGAPSDTAFADAFAAWN